MFNEAGGLNFFAADLARKVMGKTRHGSHNVVYLQSGHIAADIVHFHEDSHRSLNSASTVGKYLSSLAIAAGRRREAERELREAVRNVATLCLYTHEGYATAMQEIRSAKASLRDVRLSERLPELYILARDRYLTVYDRLAPNRLTHDSAYRLDCEEAICRVMSLAAMSTPLAGAVSAAPKLPSYRVLKQIERNAPDVRLLKLRESWTMDLVVRARAEYTQAHEQAHAGRSTRAIDNCLNRFAAELCVAAGLEFELPDAINIGAMCAQMGVPGIVEIDGRDTPLSRRAVLDSISLALAPAFPEGSRVIWHSACDLIRRVVSAIRVTPDAVLEVLDAPATSGESDELVRASLHLYTDKRRQFEYATRMATDPENRGLAESTLEALVSAGDNDAFLMMRLDTFVPRALLRTPLTMAQQFPHRSMTWVAAHVLFEESGNGYPYSLTDFEGSGRVVFPYLDGLTGLETYVALYSVPGKFELPAVPESLLEQSIWKAEAGFSTKMGLLFLKPHLKLEESAVAVVFPRADIAMIGKVGQIKVGEASYLDTCLCHTLATGAYAEFRSWQIEGETNE